jgi:hypothetical protein
MKLKLFLLVTLIVVTSKVSYSQILKDTNFVFPSLRLAASAMHSSKTKLLTFILKDEVKISFQKKIHESTMFCSNFKQELAFINFYDSLTRKEFDRCFWENNITVVRKRGKTVFTLTFDGPLLTTYKYKVKKDSLIKEKTGKFFSPSIITMGYGWEGKLFKNSRIKICYFAFDGKLKLKEKEFEDDHNYLFMGDEQYLKVDYSMNILVDINEKLAKNLYLKSFLTINACGLSQKNIVLKFSNEFCVEVTNFLDVTISSKVDYNPQFSYEIYLYNEICLNYHISRKIKL